MKKIGFDIACKLSPEETICMQCQILFPAKIRQNQEFVCWICQGKVKSKLSYFLGCPDPPTNVSLNIASSSSLLVKFGEPLNRNGAVVTKYKGKQLIIK